MIIYLLIFFFGTMSYVLGGYRIIINKYTPNTFSRIIWVILAINSFFGVYLSSSSNASVLLAFIMLLGNILICCLSIVKGTKKFGLTEYVCTSLLVISLVVWIFFKSPLTNLVISLVAHFIGAIPTYKNVWKNPDSEDVPFWSLFFIASVLSVFKSDISSVKAMLLPLYYAFFDGSIMLLTVRKYFSFSKR